MLKLEKGVNILSLWFRKAELMSSTVDRNKQHSPETIFHILPLSDISEGSSVSESF